MKIQREQVQEIQNLLKEYTHFNIKLSEIQEKIEKLDKTRNQLLEELKELHSREESLYEELARDNNISIDLVKSELINAIIT
jgi:predicted nuclease with TOPRIM domain